MKYRLNKAETSPVTLYQVPKTKNIGGRNVITYTNWMRLIPGEEYVTDDEATIEWLKDYRRKVRYNKSVENALNNAGVPYDLELCRSCGGRIKKISYNLMEVYDE